MSTFQKSNAIGNSDEEYWGNFYAENFKTMLCSMKTPNTKSVAQMLGVDRVILLASGDIIKIDEKMRDKYWGEDFLLEYHSNSNNLIHDGWMNKPLIIDYIAYSWKGREEGYLIPWEPLKKAWHKYGKEWYELSILEEKNGYRVSIGETHNDNEELLYQTYSICVPIKEVYDKISEFTL